MLAASLALSLVAPLAHAHGSGHHARKAFDPATAEQTPFGIAGDPAKVTRTIKISMGDDMRFAPDKIKIRRGETVRFIVTNKGQMLHEMVIGTPEELQEHAALMKKFPEMEHDEPHMAHVKAGTSEELVWNFNKPGQFQFACLVPGHFEAGMSGTISVIER
ncbi:cupredoxin domain-containing protein [Noviherbaspirillum sp.]|uniref:cupredoxin domain-containing protein n=1 Tax=Noviherbaspirillum sp. TaxID=1926288 RepID=UPI0039C95179